MKATIPASAKLIKFAKKLISDKKYRDSSHMFICEAHKVINNLLSQGFKLVNLLVTNESRFLNNFKNNSLTRTINNQTLRSISSLKNSDGTIAIFEKKNNKFEIKKDGKYTIVITNGGNDSFILIIQPENYFKYLKEDELHLACTDNNYTQNIHENYHVIHLKNGKYNISSSINQENIYKTSIRKFFF